MTGRTTATNYIGYFFLGAAAILAAGCAPVRLRDDAATRDAQDRREARRERETRWQLDGRIAVTDGRDGGNGELTWRQDDERYDLTIRAPVTGKTWRLHGDAGEAVLEGAAGRVVREKDAATLLRRELGWTVPVREMEYWVRGLRAPGSEASLEYDVQRRPVKLVQSGWTVEYRAYVDDSESALPRKVFATRGAHRVRLFVERWTAE